MRAPSVFVEQPYICDSSVETISLLKFQMIVGIILVPSAVMTSLYPVVEVNENIGLVDVGFEREEIYFF